MARKKKTEQPIGVGLTTKQMKRKKPLNTHYLTEVNPLTDHQTQLFDSYAQGKHLIAYGVAGTGKTFITLYNALKDVLSDDTPYETIYLVRSLVSTREIGFLPGDHEDKADIYQILNFHELDSIMTRVGDNSKIMFCGDATQSDLTKTNDRNGIVDFMKILTSMPSVDIIEFGLDDIIRSGLVKEYLVAKLELGM